MASDCKNIWVLRKLYYGASLVVQWLRIRLPMQGSSPGPGRSHILRSN